MTRHKLLIVDNCEEFPMALAEILQNDFQIRFCLDGKEALSLLQSFQPDILLLELMIPGLDGISLLQETVSLGIHPVVLTFTRFYNEYMMTALAKWNVSYWMLKPCDLHATAKRIRDLVPLLGEQRIFAADPAAYARELLFSLGLSAKHNGFHYLQEAIVMQAQNSEYSVTKHLYPGIAKKTGCSKANVEHAIRTAINRAWEKRDDAAWQQYFSSGPEGTVPRPTNSVFISGLSQELHHTK